MGSYNRFELHDVVGHFFKSQFNIGYANRILELYPKEDYRLRTKFNVDCSHETQALLLQFGIFIDTTNTLEVSRDGDKLHIIKFDFKESSVYDRYFHKLVLYGDDYLQKLSCVYFKVYKLPLVTKRITWKMKKTLWTKDKK